MFERRLATTAPCDVAGDLLVRQRPIAERGEPDRLIDEVEAGFDDRAGDVFRRRVRRGNRRALRPTRPKRGRRRRSDLPASSPGAPRRTPGRCRRAPTADRTRPQPERCAPGEAVHTDGLAPLAHPETDDKRLRTRSMIGRTPPPAVAKQCGRSRQFPRARRQRRPPGHRAPPRYGEWRSRAAAKAPGSGSPPSPTGRL